MPKYRISVQEDLDPDAARRRTRDVRPARYEFVESTSLEAALAVVRAGARPGDRIIGVEESLRFDDVTDAQILAALTSAELEEQDRLRPEDYEGYAFEMDTDVAGTVQDIATALRQSGLVSGLTVTIEHNGENFADYVMVEIYDACAAHYRSTGSETRHLIEDRQMVGWDAIVSIARTLIQIVSEEGLI